MGYKMKGFSGFGNSPAKQKKIYKEGESFKNPKTGNEYIWDSKAKKHLKVDINLQGVPASEYNKEIQRQDPEFKFPKGVGESPTKQTTTFSGDQALIKAQKELSAEEMSYKAPGWTRMATSILPGHDPTGQAKGRKKKDFEKEGGDTSAGGGIEGAKKEVKDMEELMSEFKGSGNKAKLASSDIETSDTSGVPKNALSHWKLS